MKIKIKDIAYYLPAQVVTNEDLHRENPSWNMDKVEQRAGVQKRYITSEHETALDLAFQACKKLFEKYPDARNQIDGLLFCTQSPDYIMPPNACVLHKLLELPENTFALDYNLACSGFIYGLGMARGLIHTGMAKNVLIVNSETYSKYIHKKDRSVRVIFGDGASASWITSSESDEGITDILCATSGYHYDKFIIWAGGSRTPKSEESAQLVEDDSGNVRTKEHMHMQGYEILKFVSNRVPKQVMTLLKRNGLTVGDIDTFFFHQASKMALDSLTRLLRIPQEKVYRNLHEIGNTVSASIPIALRNALDRGIVSKGNKVLLCGFGVGLSWGSALMEV